MQRRPVWSAVRAESGAAALTPFCTLRGAPGCRVASLTWLLQEQVESCCFHGYCLTLGCCDEVGREKTKKGRESKQKSLKADVASCYVTAMEIFAYLLG